MSIYIVDFSAIGGHRRSICIGVTFSLIHFYCIMFTRALNHSPWSEIFALKFRGRAGIVYDLAGPRERLYVYRSVARILSGCFDVNSDPRLLPLTVYIVENA